MRARDVVRSLTFRYIVRYITALSATVFVLLALLYGVFSFNYFSDLRDSIVDELDALRAVYAGQGLTGVEQYLRDQRRLENIGRFHYLVTDARGEYVAGDLEVVTRYREFSDGWLGFQLALLNWGEPVDADFLARAASLGEGYTVYVARNYADAVASGALVFNTLFRAMIVTWLLGIIGGYVSARSTLVRFEQLNSDLIRIVRGNLTERLSMDPSTGYARELAVVLNQVLEQMAMLMQGVKQVSDNIAHDLRTPLTRIRNQLSQLRDRLDPGGQDDVDRIIEECDGLLASFNALLRISALEAGGRGPGEQRVNLVALLQDVVELYEPVASEKGLTLDFRAGAVAECAGDADLLFQLFTNLLDNAIKYTPAGGRLALELAPAGEAIQVAVADTGPGIASEERDKVFRRFYRVESSRGVQPGHGLGLSLVRAIVSYHRGEIGLEDNRPGLRVVVTLPAARAPG
jgi:signal transduction histidine kinase